MQESSTKKIYDVHAMFYDATFGRLVKRRIERAIKHTLPRVTLPDFDYKARPASLEVPRGERIAAIRARKAEERSRARAKAERGGGGGSGSHAPHGGGGRPASPGPRRSHFSGRPGPRRRPGGN